MKYTNKEDLPPPVFDAIANDDYSRGSANISVTQLIDSPRIRVLEKHWSSEIIVDAADEVQALLGKGLHKVLEGHAKTEIAERRLSIEVNGWVLSGGMDLYDMNGGILTDYKVTNVWKFVYSDKDSRPGTISSCEKQLNVYAHILREHGEPVNQLMVFALFKDWKEREFLEFKRSGKIFTPNEKSGYPQKQTMNMPVVLWDAKIAKQYVELRVKMHQDSENKLPLCDAKDIWGGSRCKRYCKVNLWCDQYQEQSKTGKLKTESF